MSAYLDVFKDAHENGQAVFVDMGEVSGAIFSQQVAIGTHSLASCHVPVIMSNRAAVFAHIPPRPHLGTSSTAAADATRNLNDLMGRLIGLYLHLRNNGYFPAESTHVIVGETKGKLVLKHQLDMMQSHFAGVNLVAQVHKYEVPPDMSKRAYGTAVVLGPSATGGSAQLYLEDQLVATVPP